MWFAPAYGWKTTSGPIGKTRRGFAPGTSNRPSRLFSAKISTLRQETAAEQLTVHRAKRARDDADSKLKVLKKWSREYDSRVQPLLKQIEKLQTVLSIDMVKAVASLTQSINSLAAYAAKAPPPAASAAPKATEEVPTGNRGPTQKGTAA